METLLAVNQPVKEGTVRWQRRRKHEVYSTQQCPTRVGLLMVSAIFDSPRGISIAVVAHDPASARGGARDRQAQGWLLVSR